jgi:predicted phosphodiesterase
MKILIFSDTHLTHKFEPDLYDYISKVVKSADQVIINGDFWDAYLTTFDQFINSEWKKLFKLLKKKKAIYIFGNHDKEEFMDDRFNLFSVEQALQYTFKSKNKTIHVEHGHLIAPAYDSHFIWSNPKFIRGIYSSVLYYRNKYDFIDNIFHFIFEKKGNLFQLLVLRQYSVKHYEKNTYYVFGHCHTKFLDKKFNFLSCSFTKQAKLSYCLVENGRVKLEQKLNFFNKEK